MVTSMRVMNSPCKRICHMSLVILSLITDHATCAKNIPIETRKINTEDYQLSRPEINIPQGRLRGVNMLTHYNRSVFGFQGIPFAQPPVGNLRFKRPLPAGAWNGTLDAGSDANPCPQFYEWELIGDEDCLHLNVYTPELPSSTNSTLLPVMMYVPGGKFKTGSNTHTRWGPYFLLDKDVLLVVPNYRLGALGYLATGDEASPGNNALKDLVLALEWIRDNIQYFGGDPKQVTVFGGSSGAICVHLLAFSNLTDGLFHRYITQSGSVLSGVLQRPRAVLENYSIQLAEYFNCPTNSSTDLVECLRGVNAMSIVDADIMFRVWQDSPHIIWGPTVEPDLEGAFLTDSVQNLLAAGKMKDIPWISSVTRDEGILYTAQFLVDPEKFQSFLENIYIALPAFLGYQTSIHNVTAFTNALLAYYLNDLNADRTILLANLTLLIGDALFVYPSYQGFQQGLLHAKSPQYFCSFEYLGTLTYGYWYSGGSTKVRGVPHGEEILYLFENKNTFFGPPHYKMNEADRKMVNMVVDLWTSFATNGAPTPVGVNGTTIWEPFSLHKRYLRIGNQADSSLRVDSNFFANRLSFWNELYGTTSWKEM